MNRSAKFLLTMTFLLMGVCIAIFYYINRGNADDEQAVSPSRSMILSDNLLVKSQKSAMDGNCDAAFLVNQHYSFGMNDMAEATKWLRLAAKCPVTLYKRNMVIHLLLTEDKPNLKEIDELINQIRFIDPIRAEEVRAEVENELKARDR